MWLYNGFCTRDNCLGVCLLFTLEGLPNNGRPPLCTIADCLRCDEVESGPLFQKVAARSRRRSGLLSKIASPCDAILFVNTQNHVTLRLPLKNRPWHLPLRRLLHRRRSILSTHSVETVTASTGMRLAPPVTKCRKPSSVQRRLAFCNPKRY